MANEIGMNGRDGHLRREHEMGKIGETTAAAVSASIVTPASKPEA